MVFYNWLPCPTEIVDGCLALFDDACWLFFPTSLPQHSTVSCLEKAMYVMFRFRLMRNFCVLIFEVEQKSNAKVEWAHNSHLSRAFMVDLGKAIAFFHTEEKSVQVETFLSTRIRSDSVEHFFLKMVSSSE